jgi:3-oxoacyl-[acyl-carrier-protein] synthase II
VSTAVAVAPLAITGCGVVSPAGLGLAPLGQALCHGLDSHAGPVADALAGYPPHPVWAVPELPVAEQLGRKGLRNVDRLTTLGLLACKQALDQAGTPLVTGEDSHRVGVVMATSTGSLRSQADIASDTLVQDKPYLVHPGRFPNVVLNSCAGQIAIWNALKGVNATVASGQVSSLAAVRYARTAIGRGRATMLLVGGVEELCLPVAWGWHLSAALTADAPIGEGCAVFLVEDGATAAAAGRGVLARLLGCEVGYFGAAPQRRALADGLVGCIGRALERSGLVPDDIDVVSLGATNHIGLARLEERALRRVLGRPVRRVRVTEVLGECYSASAAMQIAGLLALWQQEPAGASSTALVTSVGNDGNLGCLVVGRS